MKKYIAVLLCLTLVIGMLMPTTGVMALDVIPAGGNIVDAQQLPSGVDVTKPITEESWGKATYSVNKDSANAFLREHNSPPDVDSMDVWVRWDKTNLYIGVVSPDAEPTGNDKSWEGDGLQFKIAAGANEVMPADALNAYFTLGPDNEGTTAGGAAENWTSSVQIVDGNMHAATAIPFEDLGLTGSDIRTGAAVTFSIIRISGTEDHAYAGWLAWGPFFGLGNKYNETCTGDNIIVLSNELADVASVVGAPKAYNAPDATKIVDEDTWGKPVIRVDKNTYNSSLWQHNSTPEDTWMDVYASWDAKYLYLGFVSPDTDPRGDADSWEGDGVQFKIYAGSGSSMPSEAKNIYFTLGDDNVSMTAGDSCATYAKNIAVVDGLMHATIAIPHEDIGLIESDVKAGAEYKFDIIRISGTADHEYAGWLSWGPFFGVEHKYNANGVVSNSIVLQGDAIEVPTVVVADKIYNAPDASQIVDEDIWGKPVIRVDKNTYNSSLWEHNSATEDGWMDVYASWDAKYLYLGFVSPDTDPRGDADSWEGDGVQFKIYAGSGVMPNEAKNIYFTLGEDNVSMTAGDSCATYAKNIAVVDGLMHATIAIPHEDIGLIESEVKAGAEYKFDIIRISGTTDHTYAGWLSWGPFFGVEHKYNENGVISNSIVLGGDAAVSTTTVEAEKVNNAPDATDIITEEAWGAPVIKIDKDTYNSSLWQHNSPPEDTWMEVYATWDYQNLYLGFKSPDADPRGDADSWEGDGVQFKIYAGSGVMPNEAKNIYFTLGDDNVSMTAGDSCATYAKSIQVVDGMMYATIAIPHADIGLVASEVKAGAEYKFSIIRISGTSEHEYAGWLSWGPFFGVEHKYNINGVVDNSIVLAGGVQADGTETAFESLLVNLPKAANSVMAADGITYKFGDTSSNKILKTADGTYVLYATLKNVLGDDFINEFSLQKVTDEGVVELGFGYTLGGTQNIVADKDGNIYVIGGGSNWDFLKYSDRYTYTDFAEEAELNIWKYDPKTGVMSGFAANVPFTNVVDGGHEFIASDIDVEAGKIYAAFTGKKAEQIKGNDVYTDVEYFTFDIATMTWGAESVAYDIINITMNKIAVYALEGGMGLMYANDNAMIFVDVNGEKVGRVFGNAVSVAQRSGQAVVLFEDEEGNYCTTLIDETGKPGEKSFETGLKADVQVAAVTQIDDTYYMVALSREDGTTVTLYSSKMGTNYTEVYSMVYDVDVVHTSSLILTSTDTSTVSDGSIAFMFAGYRGKALSWYMGSVSLTPPVVEAE